MPEKKVLIVDDEPDVVTYLTLLLENDGYTVYSASSAGEGFDLVEIVEPDLVCLDIMMPKQLGLSLYEKMKRKDKLKNIPVLIISGVISEQDFEFRKLVPDNSIPPPQEYMEKPIKRELFLKTVAGLIGGDRVDNKVGN
jgi:CheY-like chemotaxis protein